MEYLVEGEKFTMDYRELRAKYQGFTEMDDKTFMQNLIDATHFACYVCYLKNISSQICLSDKGIIHELIHLMKDETMYTPLEEVRKMFNEQLELK